MTDDLDHAAEALARGRHPELWPEDPGERAAPETRAARLDAYRQAMRDLANDTTGDTPQTG